MPTETGTYYKQGPSVGKGMKKRLGNRGNVRSTDNLLFKSKKLSNASKLSSARPISLKKSDDPEAEPDFDRAYRSLVTKMYNEAGQQISGLITENELEKADH